MITICTNTPIPDLEDLREQVNKSISDLVEQFPNFTDLLNQLKSLALEPVAALLPTIRNIIYEGYSNITQEINEIIEGIKHYQDIISMGSIFSALASVIGGAIDDLVPKIPILDIPFTELLAMNADAIYEAVKQALLSGVQFPFIPLPIFEGFTNLTKELVHIVKSVIINYKNILIQAMQDMIKKVLDILEIAASIPALLTVPTAQEIIDLILSFFPDYKSIYEVIKNTGKSIYELLQMTGLPVPNIKEVFINFYSNIAEEFSSRINQVIDFISSLNIKTLIDFINNTLGQLGIEFPTFCFTLEVSQ